MTSTVSRRKFYILTKLERDDGKVICDANLNNDNTSGDFLDHLYRDGFPSIFKSNLIDCGFFGLFESKSQ